MAGNNRYCMYLRKSRADAEAEARGEGETLKRHEAFLLDLARRQGLIITSIYREIVSGETIASRPEMQRLLEDVGAGVWDGVLVMEVERLARGDTIDQGLVNQTFKYSNTKIITPAKTYDPTNEFDEEYFEFGLFMSRREYKTINRRLQNGRISSVNEGKYVGAIPAYGYRKIKAPNGRGFTLDLEIEEAKVVWLMFDWYANGYDDGNGVKRSIGFAGVASALNDLGFRTRSGSRWQAARISDIIHNPLYAGKIRWGYEKVQRVLVDGKIVKRRVKAKDGEYMVVDGIHPAIVTFDLWLRAQRIADGRVHIPKNSLGKTTNPLSGLIICQRCGKRMQRKLHNGRQPDTIFCPDVSCNNISAPVELIERRILLTLEGWLTNYKIAWGGVEPTEPISQISSFEAAIDHAKKERDTIKRQTDKLYDLLEQGLYDESKFLERSRTLSDRLQDVEKVLADAVKKLETAKKTERAQKEIIPKVENVLALYQTQDGAGKNDLLKSVVSKAFYNKTQKGNRTISPDSFELIVIPKIDL